MTTIKTSEPKRNRLFTKAHSNHKNGKIFRLEHMVEDDMNTTIRMFADKFGNDVFDESIIDRIRVIVGVVKETTNALVDRVRLNKIELQILTMKSNV